MSMGEPLHIYRPPQSSLLRAESLHSVSQHFHSPASPLLWLSICLFFFQFIVTLLSFFSITYLSSSHVIFECHLRGNRYPFPSPCLSMSFSHSSTPYPTPFSSLLPHSFLVLFLIRLNFILLQGEWSPRALQWRNFAQFWIVGEHCGEN